MGLMNNSQYVIKVVKEKGQGTAGSRLEAFQFVHPVNGALQSGGWMTTKAAASEASCFTRERTTACTRHCFQLGCMFHVFFGPERTSS